MFLIYIELFISKGSLVLHYVTVHKKQAKKKEIFVLTVVVHVVVRRR